MTRADLASYTMMQEINQELKMMVSASANLTDVVRKRGRVAIDTGKLAEHAIKVLDASLAKAVEEPVRRIAQAVQGFEDRVGKIGAEKLDEVIARTEVLERSSVTAERRVERLSGKVTWAAVGRMTLALLPFVVAFIVLGGLVGGASQMLGIGPLLGWAWDAFETASAWWSKALIALGALGGYAGFGWVIWRVGKKLYEQYRGW